MVAVPCVGDAQYLMDQMKTLSGFSENSVFPSVLSLKSDLHNSKTFAEPTAAHLQIWQELCKVFDLTFDLVYSPKAWEQILLSWKEQPELWSDSNIMYVHCGGVEGNESQLARYRRKGLFVSPS